MNTINLFCSNPTLKNFNNIKNIYKDFFYNLSKYIIQNKLNVPTHLPNIIIQLYETNKPLTTMKTTKGDIIKLAKQQKFDIIIHGCNCMCVMGAGIAKQIKKHFPKAYQADKTTKRACRNKMGTYSSYYDQKYDVTIVNAYTEYDYRGKGIKINYDSIRQVFEKIKHDFKDQKIAFPKIGAGLGGGDWSRITNIINEELDGEDYTFVEYRR